MNVGSFESQPRHGDVDTFDVEASITRLKKIIFKHKLVILLSCLFCLSLVWTYKSLFPPIYKAEVLVQAEAEEDRSRESFYASWNTFRKSELSSEKVLMTSSPVIRNVVEELNLTYDDVYHTHMKHAIYLWEKSVIGNYYRKVKHWFFPIEKSPFELSEEEADRSRAIKGFKDGAQLEAVPDSHVGYLVVKGPTYRVAEYANKLIDSYASFRRESYAEEARLAYDSLSKEVNRAERERDYVMETKLLFENENGLAMGFLKDQAIMKNWAVLDQRIQGTEFKLHKLEALLEVVNEQFERESPVVLRSNQEGRNPIRDQILDSLFNLQKDLDSVRLVYQPESPEIRNIEKRILDLKKSLPAEAKMVGSGISREVGAYYEKLRAQKQEIEADLASTRAELLSMRATQEGIKSRITEIPGLEKKYLVLKRDQEIALIKVRSLREKLLQADISRITALSAPPSLKVIEYASAPEKPYWPNTKLLIIVALMLGISGGIGLAIIIETLDSRATQINLLSRTDLPVYAVVEISHRSNGLRRLIFRPKPNSIAPSEQFATERLKDINQ